MNATLTSTTAKTFTLAGRDFSGVRFCETFTVIGPDTVRVQHSYYFGNLPARTMSRQEARQVYARLLRDGCKRLSAEELERFQAGWTKPTAA
jgi:hypothetical protein